MTYKLQTVGMLIQPSRALVKLVCTRLAIQGIVHCIVVNKCSRCPRWKFNLTISVKYWYINERMRAFLVWLEFLGGIVGIMGLAHLFYSTH